MDNSETVADSDYQRRFGGIARLYGDRGLLQISKASVCVIGIGGVGSWVAESLARSGIGAITLIDMDLVATSNINRQLIATSDSVGRDKVLVMSERIQQINPACLVTPVDDFLRLDNLEEYITEKFDYIIDCIDDFRVKSALIAHCRSKQIAILTVGAAGGLVDPSKVRRSDLSLTQHDNLLAKTRKQLRQKYAFARNPKRIFGVPCVYSDEQSVFPDGNGGVSKQRLSDNNDNANSSSLNCAGGMALSRMLRQPSQCMPRLMFCRK